MPIYGPPGGGTLAAKADKASLPINVRDAPYSAAGDGTTSDTTAIQAALTASRHVVFPAGYTFLTGSLTVPDGTKIAGWGSTLKASGTGAVLVLGSDCEVRGLTLDGNSVAGSNGITATGKARVQIQFCRIKNMIQKGVQLSTTTDSVISDCHISNCTQQAVNLFYSDRTRVADNLLTNAQHGVQYWGGDSAVNTLADPGMGTFDLTISGNVINTVVGGIWGSLGQRITVTGNTVRNCSDVGIDFEGSADCVASGNTVAACTNGGMTVFYVSTRCNFTGNTVNQAGGYGPAFKVFGTGVSNLLLIDSNFLLTDGATDALVTNGNTLSDSTISGNLIRTASGKPIRILDGPGRVSITGNNCETATGGFGIAIEGPSNCHVTDNYIRSASDSTAVGFGAAGIFLYYRSATYPAQYNTILGNTVLGFVNSIVDVCGSNSTRNLIMGNRADTITHQGTGTYTGMITSNQSATGALVSAVPLFDVQTFTGNGTWTKPSGAQLVTVVCIGSGGAGGSGAQQVSGAACSGGGGGGGAGFSQRTIPASLCGATETIAIAGAATGGAAQASTTTAGVAGGNGGVSSFGNHVKASGGGGGGGGQLAAASVGGTTGTGLVSGGTGGVGANGGVGASASATSGSPAGAAGGGISTTPAAFAGGSGSGSNQTLGGTSGAAGTSGGGAGGNGSSVPANEAHPGYSGGGGGSSITVAGGGGGNGGNYGTGGGGGGSSLNGFSSGVGGNGGVGIVVVISQ